MNNLSSNHGALVDGLNRAVLPCHKWNPYNTTSHSGRDGLPCNVIDRAGNVSWKALDWATDSQVGSSTTKFILLLLANKADENFSCYPSIRTLMAESDAGRSTVMRALKELEASGFITREPQFHDSGARRSNRYYLNHPLAPHCSPRPNPGPHRPDSTRHPTGVPNRDPLKPPPEPPTQPDARTLAGRRERCTEAHACCRNGSDVRLDGQQLGGISCARPQGVRSPARVLARRLADVPDAIAGPRPTVEWCGECEDERSRTITVTLSDGTNRPSFVRDAVRKDSDTAEWR